MAQTLASIVILFGLISGRKQKENVLYPFSEGLLEELKKDVRHRTLSFQRPDQGGGPGGPDRDVLGATLIRLSFHDCAGKGGCNGCININNNMHNGLEYGAIFPIEQVYQNSVEVTLDDITYSTEGFDSDPWESNPSGIKWSDIISRSDMWANAAIINLETGVEVSYNNCLTDRDRKEDEEIYPDTCITGEGPGRDILSVRVASYDQVCINEETKQGIPKGATGNEKCASLPYYVGRIDCPASPYIGSEDKFVAEPHWGFEDLKKFMRDTFRLNKDETVALMGIHTLGRGHPEIDRDQLAAQEVPNEGPRTCCSGSGFRDKWKPGPTAALDNRYFSIMFGAKWLQTEADNTRNGRQEPPGTNNELQWMRIGGGGTRLSDLQLNVDMCLFLDFDDYEFKEKNELDDNEIQGKINCNYPGALEEADSSILVPDDDRGKQCERNTETQTIFDIYVYDNLRWLYDFARVYKKLSTRGYQVREKRY